MARYPESVELRAMKEQEVLLKAVSGEIKWIQAADILSVSPRTIRRKWQTFVDHGISGLLDKRCGRPSTKRVPYETVEKVLKLYREEYYDFNVLHFHENLVSKHGIVYSYTWTKNLLQEAGYVRRKKGRGGHRKRRDRRPMFGQMIHLDGSEHQWLSLRSGDYQMLLLVVDDATGKNLAGKLVEAETTRDCLSIMKEVVTNYGIPAQLYTDRKSVYWLTKKAGGKVDRENLTQFGQAMEALGVEMIPGYSPQARGRSERWNGTWQGRLVAELRKAGIKDLDAANEYINQYFLPEMNQKFAVEPKEAGSAFVSAEGANLDRIFAIRYASRTVNNDNTVRVNNLYLQIEKSPFREHFYKCKVDVYEHLNSTYSVVWQKRNIGRYDKHGKLIEAGRQPPNPRDLSLKRSVKITQRKRQKQQSPASSLTTLQEFGALPSVAHI
ncbi:MAG: ISNCY family transposase [Desulfobacterales bacterium]|nr:ISNCY family transposase [Desulfobacterales bacterium]